LAVARRKTVLWTDRLAVTARDDGKTARCVATVSGLGANTTSLAITVNCKHSVIYEYRTLQMDPRDALPHAQTPILRFVAALLRTRCGFVVGFRFVVQRIQQIHSEAK